MAVQYRAQTSRIKGGGGSGSLNTVDRGPTKTSLSVYMLAAKFRFQVIGESLPGNHSPFTGSKIRLVIN